jgi:hypothetical protein
VPSGRRPTPAAVRSASPGTAARRDGTAGSGPGKAGAVRTAFASWRRDPNRLLSIVAPEVILLLVSALLALILPTDNTPHPERVTTRMDFCDLSLHGAAQVGFSITNGDRAAHGYQVQAVVHGRERQLGTGNSLITHVDPGDTVTGRMLIQANGDVVAATCTVAATVWDGESGHHG